MLGARERERERIKSLYIPRPAIGTPIWVVGGVLDTRCCLNTRQPIPYIKASKLAKGIGCFIRGRHNKRCCIVYTTTGNEPPHTRKLLCAHVIMYHMYNTTTGL